MLRRLVVALCAIVAIGALSAQAHGSDIARGMATTSS